MSRAELENLANSLQALEIKKKYNQLELYLPDTGVYARHLYPKHVTFINSRAREKAFIAANRTGKTKCLVALITYHATGRYPEWYTGKRWSRPTSIWVVGKTAESTRNILQYNLLGDIGSFGTGMLPKSSIVNTFAKPGVPGGIEIIKVKHFTDGIYDGESEIAFKAQDQGFESFVGTHKDLIALDEEGQPDVAERVYLECLMRIMRTDKYDDESEGQVIFTFTPDHFLTPLVERFFNVESGQFREATEDKLLVNVTWDDVPHLSEAEKKRMYEELPAHLRDVKTKGIPTVGAGSIYPVSDDRIMIDPFAIPDYYEKAYGMDSSWQGNAIVWGARDPDTDTWYIYDEYFVSGVDFSIVANAVRMRSDRQHIAGVIDPAADKNRVSADGMFLLDFYRRSGLDLSKANNSLWYGIEEVRAAMETGKLRIFTTCDRLLKEKRLYRLDDKGNIINKGKYHLLDALRYLKVSGHVVARSIIDELEELKQQSSPIIFDGRDPLTGY